MSELKPLPCPFCGGAPQSVERPDNIDGTRFFYALACYCGGYSACAHKMAVEPTPEQAKRTAIEAWNRRALPAQVGQVLTDDEIGQIRWQCRWSRMSTEDSDMYATTAQVDRFARAIEQAVMAKRVPMERGWMCLTDFQHELGAAAGGVTIYPSLEDLKANRSCWEQCGVIEVGIVGEKGGA